MPGSTTYDPQPVPLGRPSYATVVYRYDPDQQAASDKWTLLTNVRLLAVEIREGPDPWLARYRYAFGDPLGDPGDPQSVEQTMPLSASGAGVVQQDDRLVACVIDPATGQHVCVHDGFVQAPQCDMGEAEEQVSIVSLGSSVREYDAPLGGAVMRNADKPLDSVNSEDGSSNDTATGNVSARFNPDGNPNCSPRGADSGDEPGRYPVFLGPCPPDHAYTTSLGRVKLRMWTLAMACRYIINIGTTRFNVGQQGKTVRSKFVQWDDLDYLDKLLAAVAPVATPGTDPALDDPDDPSNNADPDDEPEDPDDQDDPADDPDDDGTPEAEPEPSESTIDTSDPETFQYEDIFVQDLDVTGMPWMEALWRLLEPNGYGMGLVLVEGEPEDPGYPGDLHYELDVYRKDFSTRRKTLSRQARGSALDPGRTNLQTLSLARDGTGLANRVALDCAPVRVEASFVLTFAEPVDDADAGLSAVKQFRKGDPGFKGAAKDKYRLLVFDECGEGHWDWNGLEIDHTPGDFSPALLLGKKEKDWATRRRPAAENGQLLSKDDKGEPLRAKLYVSFDYEGDIPGVWDGTGEWQEVGNGQWHLLDDRLGVYGNPEDVNSWTACQPGLTTIVGTDANNRFTGGVIKTVDWSASTNPHQAPVFMVTCCVDLDDDLNVSADRRASSPTKFTVTRRVDARERFRKHVISRWRYDPDLVGPPHDSVVLDETPMAQAAADAYRRETEAGTYAGTARVPRFTAAYACGDQVTDVVGRGLNLRTNGAAEQNESAVYPVVVGISFNFDGEQSTTLSLSDHRAAPPPRRGGRLRKTVGMAKQGRRQ